MNQVILIDPEPPTSKVSSLLSPCRDLAASPFPGLNQLVPCPGLMLAHDIAYLTPSPLDRWEPRSASLEPAALSLQMLPSSVLPAQVVLCV